MLEDVKRNVLMSLHSSQFLWFKNHIKDVTQQPINVSLFFQLRYELGQCRMQKFRSRGLWFLEWVVWPSIGVVGVLLSLLD